MVAAEANEDVITFGIFERKKQKNIVVFYFLKWITVFSP